MQRKKSEKIVGERFVPMHQREVRSDFVTPEFRQTMIASTLSKKGSFYKDSSLLKSPFDYQLLTMLLWELKPATIIEFGSRFGASAHLYYDSAKMMGIPCQIYSYDIHPENVTAPKDLPGLKYSFADTGDLSKYLEPEFLLSLPHPWLISEDSHFNVSGILEFMHKFLKKSDYLIVEDLVFLLDGQPILNDFCEKHPEYLVDTFYTDNFGYNGTWFWNGILKKTK